MPVSTMNDIPGYEITEICAYGTAVKTARRG